MSSSESGGIWRTNLVQDIIVPLCAGAIFFGIMLMGSGPQAFIGDEGAQLAATAYLYEGGKNLAMPYGGAITNAFPILSSIRLLLTAASATGLSLQNANLAALAGITVISYFSAYTSLRLTDQIPRWCSHLGSLFFTFGLHAFTRNPSHFNVWSPYSVSLTFAGAWIINGKRVIPAYQLLIIGIGIGSGSHYYAIASLLLISTLSLARLAKPKQADFLTHLAANIKKPIYLCSGIAAGMLPTIFVYKQALSKIPDFTSLPRGINDQYNFGLSIYRLLVPPNQTPLVPEKLLLQLHSSDLSLGSENWDVFLGYFGLIGLSYIIILSIRGEWWAQTSLTIVLMTLIFATKGGIGNIIHAGLTDAIRAQARYSQYIYFAAISGYCRGLSDLERIYVPWTKDKDIPSLLKKCALVAVSLFLYAVSLPRMTLGNGFKNSLIKPKNVIHGNTTKPTEPYYGLRKLNNIQTGSRVLFIPTFQHPGTADKSLGNDISYVQTDESINSNPRKFKTTASLTDLWLIRDLGADTPFLRNFFQPNHQSEDDLLARWCSLDIDALIEDTAFEDKSDNDRKKVLGKLPVQIMNTHTKTYFLTDSCLALKKNAKKQIYSISPTKGFGTIESTSPNRANKYQKWQWATLPSSYIRVYAAQNLNSIKLSLQSPGSRLLHYRVNGGRLEKLTALSGGVHKYSIKGNFKTGINFIEIRTSSKPITTSNGETRTLYYRLIY